MPIHVKDGGVWKQATMFVRDGGVWKTANLSVKDGGTWKAAASVEVTISPTTQSQSFGSTVWTFNATTATVTGGTATSYNWYFTGSVGGSWSIYSGQGTAAARARVSSVASSASATLNCDVVVGGQTYTVSSTLFFTNTGGGGGWPPGP